MAPMMIPVFVFTFFAATQGQFLNCDWVVSRDCSTYASSPPECGDNGVTYPNVCDFAKAQCADDSLHILHHGACLPSEVSTTPRPPNSGVDGEVAVLDFFCRELSHRDCDTDINYVCGTDNFTYDNFCEYDKARCTHRNLHVAHFGQCGF